MYNRAPQAGRRGGRYGGGATRDEADADFLAEVTAVGPEPIHVSGVVPAYQTLSVYVTEAVRGDIGPGAQIDLDVLVASGQPHVVLGVSGLPALDASMVQPGITLHGWASYENGRWRAIEISSDGPQTSYGRR